MQKFWTIIVVAVLSAVALLGAWWLLGIFDARYSAYEANECLSWQEDGQLWEATNYEPADWMIEQCERFGISLEQR